VNTSLDFRVDAEKSPSTPSRARVANHIVETTTTPVSSPYKANAALDRIEIPPQDLCSSASRNSLKLASSSLIVSDYAIRGRL